MTLQFRRGTDSDRLDITPAVGEPIYTTDTKSLYIGDGSTAGGTLVTGGGGGTDSATVSAIILADVDSAYINARADANLDSALTISLINAEGYTKYDSGNASGQITTAINDLIGAAPASLDTLNELAAALDDDANFAATVTGQIAALPDSSQVATIITSYGYTTYDSTNTLGIVDSAYVQARQTDQDFAYSSLTGAPTTLSSFTNDTNYLDSTTVTGVIDATYVQTNQTAQDFAYSSLTGAPNVLDSADVALIAQANDTTRDSGFVTGIIDSAYINARVSATDSATVSAIITDDVDAAFINALTIDADTLGGQNSAYHLNYDNFTNTPTLYDSGNFSGQLAAASTTDLSEGTNLYYTTVRHDSDFDARLSGGTGVTVSSGQVSIGQAVGTSDSVQFSGLSTSGNIVVGGNLQVNGTTVTVNSEDLNVTDNMIYLNAGESAGSPTASIDVGWAANVNDQGSYYHVGLFRDATDETFKVYHEYTPEPDAAVQINTGHASFALAPFQASTLTGVYQGFDSDVTAAGLATQTYVTNAVAALPDSAQVATIVTSYGYSTYDSDNFTGQLTNSVISAIIDDSSLTIDGDGSTGGVKIEDGGITIRTGTGNVAFADFYCEVSNAHRTRVKSADHASYSGNVDVTLPTTTGTLALTSDIPTALSSFSNDTNYLDSTTVTGVIDATYVQTNQTAQDFAYSSLTGAPNVLDSADITNFIDATYIQANQTTFLDSALTTQLIDSAYVQARQAAGETTDPIFKTISVSGQSDVVADTTTDTLTLVAGSNITITTDAGTDTITFASSAGGLDSTAIINLIDSAYVAAREADAGGGGGTTQQTFKTIAISGQSDVVADDSADTLTLVAGTGIALTTDAGTDTVTITASGGGGGGADSATINTLIDAKLQVLDVSDVVGADGNYGEYLKSLGNGEAEWTDLATQAKQKAIAMTLIFG